VGIKTAKTVLNLSFCPDMIDKTVWSQDESRRLRLPEEFF